MSNGERMELAPVRLPYPAEAEKYGYSPEVWRVLTEAIFPNAQSPHSVTLALAYCKARGLDVMKRPIHIVPIWDSKRKQYVETIWPGIGELRTTAARTGQYAGKDETVFGPKITENLGGATVTFPEWAQVTVYRIVADAVRCAFVGPKVYWKETYATKSHDSLAPNTMWNDRASGQLEKCAEAAALRLAFPEEIGNDYSAEEMEGRKFETFARTAEGHDLMMPRRKEEPEKVTGEPLVVVDPPKEVKQEAGSTPSGGAPQMTVVSGTLAWKGAVEKITEAPTSTGGKKYSIYAKDGTKFGTFDGKVANALASHKGTGELVEIAYKTGKYGNDIVSFRAVNGPPAQEPQETEIAEPGANG